jgi:hypothetical protein
MAFTYDLSNTIGKVRLRIPDRVQAEAMFQDDEIQEFLEGAGGVIVLAVADVLDTIATDQALVLKYIKTNNLETDGSKVSKSLTDRANALRARHDKLQPTTEDEADGTFDVLCGPGSKIDDNLPDSCWF